MKRQGQLTFGQYKAIDLAITLVIMMVFEGFGILASRVWFKQSQFAFSLLPFMVALVMMRWGGYSLIHAAVGGLFYSFAVGAITADKVELSNYIVYAVGNLFSAFALFMIKYVGKEKIKEKAYLSILLVVIVFILIIIGRTIVSLFFKSSFSIFGTFLFADSLSLVFAIVAVLISRKCDGLFEDQKTYLLKLEKEKLKEKLE